MRERWQRARCPIEHSELHAVLAAAGLLFRRHPYLHPYPHCWRCGTPLIYWGKPDP